MGSGVARPVRLPGQPMTEIASLFVFSVGFQR